MSLSENYVIYDLHSHTTYSDGKLSPEELILRAKARGVSVLAVTDHDTIAGVQNAATAARKEGLGLVSGIEFSCRWNNTVVHILGFCLDVESSVLLNAVAAQEVARETRAVTISDKLAKLGFADTLSAAKTLASDGVVGRPHFAQHLVNIGAVKDMASAFKRYLGTGKPADAKFIWPPMADIIGWIQRSGGIAVLAHPAKYDLTRTKMCRLIDDFMAQGGEGIEVVNGYQDPRVTQDLAKICVQKEALASCGSDFHVPDLAWQEVGRFEPLPAILTPVWQSQKWRQIVEPCAPSSAINSR